MKYTFLAFLLFCFCATKSFSQSKNAVYIEFAGNGFLYSMNYERQIIDDNVTARIGFSYLNPKAIELLTREIRAYTLPLTFSYKYGRRKNFLEVGIGTLLAREKHLDPDEVHNVMNLTGILGYRYEAEKGFLLRISLTPQYNLAGNSIYIIETFLYWVGLSVGYHF